MALLSEWNKAVKTAFKMGRKTNKNYSLKQAMFDAKKIYKKGENMVMSIGKMRTRRNRSAKRGKRQGKMRGGSGITNELSYSNVNDSQQPIAPSSAPQANVPPQMKM